MTHAGWHTSYFLDFHPFKKPDYPEVFGHEAKRITGKALDLLGDDAKSIFDDGVNLLDLIFEYGNSSDTYSGLERMILEEEAKQLNKPELLITPHTMSNRYFDRIPSNRHDEIIETIQSTDLREYESERHWQWSELLAIWCINSIAQSANEELYRLKEIPKSEALLIDHTWYSKSYDSIGMYCFDALELYTYATLERQREHYESTIQKRVAEKDKVRFTKAALVGHAKKRAIQDRFIPYALEMEKQKAKEGKSFVVSKAAACFFEALSPSERQLFSISNFARTFADHLRKYKRESVRTDD